MSEKKLFFITYRAIGLNNRLMKELAEFFRNYHNTLITSDNLNVFKSLFNEYMKGYNGLAKPPKCEYVKDYREEFPFLFNIYVGSSSAPKTAIYLTLTPVRGVVGKSGTVEELHFEREVKAPE